MVDPSWVRMSRHAARAHNGMTCRSRVRSDGRGRCRTHISGSIDSMGSSPVVHTRHESDCALCILLAPAGLGHELKVRDLNPRQETLGTINAMACSPGHAQQMSHRLPLGTLIMYSPMKICATSRPCALSLRSPLFVRWTSAGGTRATGQ